MTPSNFPIISFVNGSFFHFSDGGLTLRFIFSNVARQHKAKGSLELLTDSACFTNYFLNGALKHSSIEKVLHLEYVLNENIHL